MRKDLSTSLKKTLRRFTYGSILKRLGYSRDTKLLIIHADDMGLSLSENSATIEALEKGMVNSASIMVPCIGFNDAASYAKINPQADLGIHLTLTSEWNDHKWGSVLPPEELRSIVDGQGFFPESKAQITMDANPAEVDKEFRAQLRKAEEAGIRFTHIDTHMFTAFSNADIIKKYTRLGREYKVPVLMTYDLPVSTWFFEQTPVVDNLFCATPEDYNLGLDNYYTNILKSLNAGLNILLVHTAFNTREMQDITGNRPGFGPAWRQADFDFFTGGECGQLIRENNIKLITWREIGERLYN